MLRDACVLLAVTTSLATAQTRGAVQIAVGPNVQVSAPRAEEAHYETHAAAHPSDPARLLVGSIIYYKTGGRGTIVYASADGGKSWTSSFHDEVLNETGDPAVAYGPDGTAYYATLTSRGHPLETKPAQPAHNWDGRKTLLFRSPDGGARWEEPAAFPFADREWVVVDATGGKYHGRVYVNGDKRPNAGLIVFTSVDSGRTFPAPGVAADAGATSMGNAVVASDGTLVGVFADASHMRAVASADGGQTLRPSVVIDTFVKAGHRKDPKRNNVNHFSNAAIDASAGPYKDRLYVVWPDRRTGRSQVYLASSSDKGATWSKGRVVTDNPATDTTDQFMPTVAVNKDGVVGLLWYDRRDNPDNRSYYARFAASLDGGATWTPSVRVSAAPYAAGPVAQKSAFANIGGDTAGLVATADGVFHPVWVDDRTGVPQAWTAAITVNRGGAIP